MKHQKLANATLAAGMLLSTFSSCKSDPNPFEITVTTENNKSTIRLQLEVEATRAEEDLSTADEKKITKVNIYVFNEKHELETTTSNVTVTEGQTSFTLEVSHGLKTIYVITAEPGVISSSKDTPITTFENQIFVSTLDKLKNSAGHMMVGKSSEQMVMNTASESEIPASNVFNIQLVRLLAKAQVKASGLNGADFGMTLGEVTFKASQTNDRMMLVHNGSDLVSTYLDSNNNGTYDNYSINETPSDYLSSVTAFSGSGCAYMPENIVAQPKSGNTTFLSVRIKTTPEKYHSFSTTDFAPKISSDVVTEGMSYYVVGIVDRENGVCDYTVDADAKIIAFKDKTYADNYCSKLNNGTVSSITVSQTENQYRAPGVRAGETSTAEFEVFTFTSGYAYYRVNLAHKEKSGDSTVMKNKVVRNKFYKVNINSVNNLGFSTEALLRPTNAAASLDAHGSSWISASMSVADWDSVEQSVDL